MAEWEVKPVGLTAEQKTEAIAQTNSAKRFNSIIASVVSNVDAGFQKAGSSVDAKIAEQASVDKKYVDTQISETVTALKAGLGTNFAAKDIAERDALTDLSVSDICLVDDNGDGKWAKYEVTSIDGGVTWTKLLDQDMLTDANIDAVFAQINDKLAELENAGTAQLAEAKQYTDDSVTAASAVAAAATAQALTDAKAYTDQEVATAKSEATSANESLESSLRTDLDPSVSTHLGTDEEWGIA